MTRLLLLTAAAGLACAVCAGLSLAIAAAPAADGRRSGFTFMSAESQAMQNDDAANPGMLWVLDGEQLWNETVGAAKQSCAGCHGSAAISMKGVAARYPAFSPEHGGPIDLQGRVNLCREGHQKATPLPLESRDLLALTAYVARQSRAMPITPPKDMRLEPYRHAGEALFRQRQGQLNLSCAECHDDNSERKLAGAPITQGHPTGYPLYRLEWQALGSLQRRVRSCLVGVRAEPFPYGGEELVNLELYLMARAQGMPLEAPGVRP
jgi:L-cysteine S-thiosulfotransferase